MSIQWPLKRQYKCMVFFFFLRKKRNIPIHLNFTVLIKDSRIKFKFQKILNSRIKFIKKLAFSCTLQQSLKSC